MAPNLKVTTVIKDVAGVRRPTAETHVNRRQKAAADRPGGKMARQALQSPIGEHRSDSPGHPPARGEDPGPVWQRLLSVGLETRTGNCRPGDDVASGRRVGVRRHSDRRDFCRLFGSRLPVDNRRRVKQLRQHGGVPADGRH